MTFANIHYDLIGTAVGVESFPGGLEGAIAKYKETGSSATAAVIATMAMHHYGLLLEDFGDVDALIAEMAAMEETLKFS